MQQYSHFVVYYLLGHAIFKEIANIFIIVCVISVNRYGDKDTNPCENYRNKIWDRSFKELISYK